MIAVSRASTELRCHAPDPTRPGRRCNRKLAESAEPWVHVQREGLAIACPRCGAVQRFAVAPTLREAA